MQVGVQVQVFLHAQVFVQPEALWHVADAVLHRLRIGRHVDAQHLKAPGVGLKQPGHHAQQGCLACAVRPDEGGQLARAYRHRHIVHRKQRAAARRLEGLAQALGNDRCVAVVHCAVPVVR